MIRRRTWVMLALFGLALALAIWWSQRSPEDSGQAAPTPGPEPLWQVPPGQVVEIQVEELDRGTTIRARRDEERGWVLLEPEVKAGQADSGRLERAVTVLIVLRPVEVLEGGRLSEYGLDQPLYRATLTLQDGSARSVLIGRDAPTGDVSYAQLPGDDRVFLLQSFAVQEVTGLIPNPPVVTPAGGDGTTTPGSD